MNIKNYVLSFSTLLGFFMGGMYYISYASPTQCWTDPYLIGVSIFISLFAPYYSKWSNKIDEKICFVTASVFAGKISRFSAQVLFNIAIFAVLTQGASVSSESISQVGGIIGISLMISLTSQGLQYLAIACSNRDIGNKNLNVLISVTVSILVGAIAAQGLPYAQPTLEACGIIFGIIGLFYSGYTDLSGIFAPQGGIGLFFGTFNPAHKTHAKMIKDFVIAKNLQKVIIHPTLIPKVHRLALEKGQIYIKDQTNGMRIYATTEKADVHVNYFMTGNKFYEIEHRVNMLKTMVKEENLEDIVEVWNSPELYNDKGFYSVIAAVKKKFPGAALHGLHGSDVGGMIVRSIYDESIGIYPYAVKRKDNISATAIRKGATGMTTWGVEEYIRNLRTELAI